jgi:hypothetical protein
VREDVRTGKLVVVNGGGMSPAKQYRAEPMLPKEERDEIAKLVRTTLGIEKDAEQ